MSFDHEKEMQRRALNRSRQCRHFNGMANERCEVGVAYVSVRIDAPTIRESHPCFDSQPSPHPRCSMCIKPTVVEARVEIDAEEIEHKAMFAAIREAHEVASGKGLRKGWGGSGEMPCPKCGAGILRYTVSSFNGHMHGHCDTPNCLSWIE